MMPAYNADRYIDKAIESLLEQTYPDWELIIVNDGSTDRTAEIALHYTDPRIKVVDQDNAGEAAARNTALKYMRGEFIAFLDADDLYLPEHLELSVGYLRIHPEYDAVYTDGYYINSDGDQLYSLSSQRRGPFDGYIFDEVVLASDVFGPPICVVLRSELVFQYHLNFDTDIVIGPDWDFFIHYTNLAQFGHIDSRTCLYRVHQTNITVQVDLQRRALYLARCREKAIKIDGFNRCSAETRASVFYDLLVNLLIGFPERQSAITKWPEFTLLPVEEQARIYRLMASKSILRGISQPAIDEWLLLSKRLNPEDRRGDQLARLYNLSPLVCKLFLRGKLIVKPDKSQTSPFNNLKN